MSERVKNIALPTIAQQRCRLASERNVRSDIGRPSERGNMAATCAGVKYSNITTTPSIARPTTRPRLRQ